jgi:hypothetical protein
MSVQRLKVAFLQLDLTCSVVTHSEEIIATGESHSQKSEGIFEKRRLGNGKGTTIEICNMES